MLDSVNVVLQNRKLIVASFSRYWNDSLYIEALSYLIQCNDTICIFTICKELLEHSNEQLLSLFNNCEECILLCQLGEILIHHNKEIIKQVGFDLIERVLSDVVKRFNTEFSSSFLYLELKNYCTTVVKGMTSQLNESATMHKRYENLVQLIQSFEM